MVIYMSDKKIKTVGDIRAFLEGTVEVKFSITDKDACYKWMQHTLIILHLQALYPGFELPELLLVRCELAVSSKSLHIAYLMLFHPSTQHIGIDTQALGRIGTCIALIQYQAHCVQLEFF